MAKKPLEGIRVVEMQGIGPGPLGGCILADFGADVVVVNRVREGCMVPALDPSPVTRGKRSIALDLKSDDARRALRQLVARSDVLIEPYRPGVMERLGLGPQELCADNPRLIYARMTGWGQSPRTIVTAVDGKEGNATDGQGKEQSGNLVQSAGHDANYIALSGLLDMFRRGREAPSPPVNFAADYAGGGVMLAMGVLLCLIERSRSGLGQVIDAAMMEGANYAALPMFKWLQHGKGPLLRRGPHGHLDTRSILTQAPHYVHTYKCLPHPDRGVNEYVAVQAIEPQFYSALLQGLGLGSEVEAGRLPHQDDPESWEGMTRRFAQIFATRTRDEWARVFAGTDACVAPVLSASEAARHPHMVARGSFLPTPDAANPNNNTEPAAAPRLSRTPAYEPRRRPVDGQHTREVLEGAGLAPADIERLLRQRVAIQASESGAAKL